MITIGIISHNNAPKALSLLKDIKYLEKTTLDTIRVIFVNNGSTRNYDKVVEQIKKFEYYSYYEFRGVTEYHSEALNFCIEGMRNMYNGFDKLYAKGDNVYYLLPDDVRLVKDFFYLSNLLVSDPEVAAAVPTIYEGDFSSELFFRSVIMPQWSFDKIQKLVLSNYVNCNNNIYRQLRELGRINSPMWSFVIHNKGMDRTTQTLPWCRASRSYSGMKHLNQTHVKK